jgi:ribosomal protein S6
VQSEKEVRRKTKQMTKMKKKHKSEVEKAHEDGKRMVAYAVNKAASMAESK